jgi:hypothetical protein
MQARRSIFAIGTRKLSGSLRKTIAEERGNLMPLHYVKFYQRDERVNKKRNEIP